jgi:hypothetical protein
MKFRVEAVNIAAAKGVAKHEVPEIILRENFGIAGDAHAGPWHRQVSLLAGEAIDAMKTKGLALARRGLEPGKSGRNDCHSRCGTADHPDRQGVPQPLRHFLQRR